MAEKKNRVGERYFTNEGYEVEVIEYFNKRNLTIKFLYNGKILKNIFFHNLKAGGVKNPFKIGGYGVGYFGVGDYKSTDETGNETACYNTWKNMLHRCYANSTSIRNKSYSECTVAEEWHNYQNFAKWYKENYDRGYMVDWVLDKDILIKGNKIYSPETCAFVPREINLTFVSCSKTKNDYLMGVSFHKRDKKFTTKINIDGKQVHLGYFNTEIEAFLAYKTAKEGHVKRLAEKWKDLVFSNVYDALLKYEVIP